MDPYQQQQQRQQQQLMAALRAGINPYPPPLPQRSGNMAAMNNNNLTLTTPLMQSVFGDHHPQQPYRHPTTPMVKTIPLPLSSMKRSPAMTVDAPMGMNRPPPKSGHVAKKIDGKSTGPWSHKEHQQFEKAVIIYGWGNWVLVKSRIEGRTKDQCKSHAQKFAKHHPNEKARLDREHDAYVEMQLHHRKSKRTKKKAPVRKVRSSNRQDETLPIVTKKVGTAAKNSDKGQSTVTPSPKHTAKSKTPSSPKDTSSANDKKMTATPKLSTKTEQSKQGETESLVRVQKGNTTNEKDDVANKELLPVVNTITPPTKSSREPAVSRASPAEASELLAMSNSMNMEAVNKAQQPKKKEAHQNESLKRKAVEIDASPPVVHKPSEVDPQSPPMVHKPSEIDPQSSHTSPPVVHKPNEVDPESIDKLCAEIYERKRMKESHLKASIQRSL